MFLCRVASASSGQKPRGLLFWPIGRLQAVCKYTDKYSIANSEAPGCTENSGTQMLALLPRYDQEFSSQAPLYAALACLRLHSIFGVILFLLGSHGRRFAMTPPVVYSLRHKLVSWVQSTFAAVNLARFFQTFAAESTKTMEANSMSIPLAKP